MRDPPQRAVSAAHIVERLLGAAYMAQKPPDVPLLMGKARRQRILDRVESVRQHERFPDNRAPHLVNVGGGGEFDGVVQVQCLEHRAFRVQGRARVGGFVKRALDRHGAVAIGRGSAAETGVALKDQHPLAGVRIKRPGRQAAEPRPDHDCVVALCHSACLAASVCVGNAIPPRCRRLDAGQRARPWQAVGGRFG